VLNLLIPVILVTKMVGVLSFVSRLLWSVKCFVMSKDDEGRYFWGRVRLPRLAGYPVYEIESFKVWEGKGGLRWGGAYYVVSPNYRPGVVTGWGYRFSTWILCSYPGYIRRALRRNGKLYYRILGSYAMRLRGDVREISSHHVSLKGVKFPIYVVENRLGDRIRLSTLAAYTYKVLREVGGGWVDILTYRELVNSSLKRDLLSLAEKLRWVVDLDHLEEETYRFYKLQEFFTDFLELTKPSFDPRTRIKGRGVPSEEELVELDQRDVMMLFYNLWFLPRIAEYEVPDVYEWINDLWERWVTEIIAILAYEARIIDIIRIHSTPMKHSRPERNLIMDS